MGCHGPAFRAPSCQVVAGCGWGRHPCDQPLGPPPTSCSPSGGAPDGGPWFLPIHRRRAIASAIQPGLHHAGLVPSAQATAPFQSSCRNVFTGTISIPLDSLRRLGSLQTTMRRRTSGWSSAKAPRPRRCSAPTLAIDLTSIATYASPSTKSTSGSLAGCRPMADAGPGLACGS